jgi:hypothetical protein
MLGLIAGYLERLRLVAALLGGAALVRDDLS